MDFTKRAQRDIRSILIYSERQWGPDQSDAYEAALTDAAHALLNHPMLGVACEELGQGLRARLVENHIIYPHPR